jgi:hypothetical protein
MQNHSFDFGTWLTRSMLPHPQTGIDCGSFSMDIAVPVGQLKPFIREIREFIDPW